MKEFKLITSNTCPNCVSWKALLNSRTAQQKMAEAGVTVREVAEGDPEHAKLCERLKVRSVPVLVSPGDDVLTAPITPGKLYAFFQGA